MTRVLVVDDHPMWRDGVARDLTEAGYQVIAAVGEAKQAVRVGASLKPDVALVDLQLPDGSGVDVIHGLLAAHPAMRILVLSSRP
jgi:DNA-binding NarL/FixJ family response regulator